MGLLSRNMKSYISHNADENISHNIMRSCPLPTVHAKKRWIPIGSNKWLQMQCATPRTKGWERPNLMCNAIEKTYEGKQKKEWQGKLTTKCSHLAPNLNTNRKVRRLEVGTWEEQQKSISKNSLSLAMMGTLMLCFNNKK